MFSGRSSLSALCPDSVDTCPRTMWRDGGHFREWRCYAVFKAFERLASGLQYLTRKPHSLAYWRTAMKFETLMLNSFFAVCVALCVSTLTAMLA